MLPSSSNSSTSTRASPNPIALADGIEKLIQSFSIIREWVDYIKWVSNVQAFVISHSSHFDSFPHKLRLISCLSKCLEPSLPTGLHIKVLQLFSTLFTSLGPDQCRSNLWLFLPSIIASIGYIASPVWPTMKEILLKHIIPLSIGTNAIEPILSECFTTLNIDGEGWAQPIIEMIFNSTPNIYSYLWKVVAFYPKSRENAIHFLNGQEQPKISSELLRSLMNCLSPSQSNAEPPSLYLLRLILDYIKSIVDIKLLKSQVPFNEYCEFISCLFSPMIFQHPGLVRRIESLFSSNIEILSDILPYFIKHDQIQQISLSLLDNQINAPKLNQFFRRESSILLLIEAHIKNPIFQSIFEKLGVKEFSSILSIFLEKNSHNPHQFLANFKSFLMIFSSAPQKTTVFYLFNLLKIILQIPLLFHQASVILDIIPTDSVKLLTRGIKQVEETIFYSTIVECRYYYLLNVDLDFPDSIPAVSSPSKDPIHLQKELLNQSDIQCIPLETIKTTSSTLFKFFTNPWFQLVDQIFYVITAFNKQKHSKFTRMWSQFFTLDTSKEDIFACPKWIQTLWSKSLSSLDTLKILISITFDFSVYNSQKSNDLFLWSHWCRSEDGQPVKKTWIPFHLSRYLLKLDWKPFITQNISKVKSSNDYDFIAFLFSHFGFSLQVFPAHIFSWTFIKEIVSRCFLFGTQSSPLYETCVWVILESQLASFDHLDLFHLYQQKLFGINLPKSQQLIKQFKRFIFEEEEQSGISNPFGSTLLLFGKYFWTEILSCFLDSLPPLDSNSVFQTPLSKQLILFLSTWPSLITSTTTLQSDAFSFSAHPTVDPDSKNSSYQILDINGSFVPYIPNPNRGKIIKKLAKTSHLVDILFRVSLLILYAGIIEKKKNIVDSKEIPVNHQLGITCIKILEACLYVQPNLFQDKNLEIALFNLFSEHFQFESRLFIPFCQFLFRFGSFGFASNKLSPFSNPISKHKSLSTKDLLPPLQTKLKQSQKKINVQPYISFNSFSQLSIDPFVFRSMYVSPTNYPHPQSTMIDSPQRPHISKSKLDCIILPQFGPLLPSSPKQIKQWLQVVDHLVNVSFQLAKENPSKETFSQFFATWSNLTGFFTLLPSQFYTTYLVSIHKIVYQYAQLVWNEESFAILNVEKLCATCLDVVVSVPARKTNSFILSTLASIFILCTSLSTNDSLVILLDSLFLVEPTFKFLKQAQKDSPEKCLFRFGFVDRDIPLVEPLKPGQDMNTLFVGSPFYTKLNHISRKYPSSSSSSKSPQSEHDFDTSIQTPVLYSFEYHLLSTLYVSLRSARTISRHLLLFEKIISCASPLSLGSWPTFSLILDCIEQFIKLLPDASKTPLLFIICHLHLLKIVHQMIGRFNMPLIGNSTHHLKVSQSQQVEIQQQQQQQQREVLKQNLPALMYFQSKSTMWPVRVQDYNRFVDNCLVILQASSVVCFVPFDAFYPIESLENGKTTPFRKPRSDKKSPLSHLNPLLLPKNCKITDSRLHCARLLIRDYLELLSRVLPQFISNVLFAIPENHKSAQKDLHWAQILSQKKFLLPKDPISKTHNLILSCVVPLFSTFVFLLAPHPMSLSFTSSHTQGKSFIRQEKHSTPAYRAILKLFSSSILTSCQNSCFELFSKLCVSTKIHSFSFNSPNNSFVSFSSLNNSISCFFQVQHGLATHSIFEFTFRSLLWEIFMCPTFFQLPISCIKIFLDIQLFLSSYSKRTESISSTSSKSPSFSENVLYHLLQNQPQAPSLDSTFDQSNLTKGFWTKSRSRSSSQSLHLSSRLKKSCVKVDYFTSESNESNENSEINTENTPKSSNSPYSTWKKYQYSWDMYKTPSYLPYCSRPIYFPNYSFDQPWWTIDNYFDMLTYSLEFVDFYSNTSMIPPLKSETLLTDSPSDVSPPLIKEASTSSTNQLSSKTNIPESQNLPSQKNLNMFDAPPKTPFQAIIHDSSNTASDSPFSPIDPDNNQQSGTTERNSTPFSANIFQSITKATLSIGEFASDLSTKIFPAFLPNSLTSHTNPQTPRDLKSFTSVDEFFKALNPLQRNQFLTLVHIQVWLSRLAFSSLFIEQKFLCSKIFNLESSLNKVIALLSKMSKHNSDKLYDTPIFKYCVFFVTQNLFLTLISIAKGAPPSSHNNSLEYSKSILLNCLTLDIEPPSMCHPKYVFSSLFLSYLKSHFHQSLGSHLWMFSESFLTQSSTISFTKLSIVELLKGLYSVSD